MLCKDCELYKNRYYPCENPENKECAEFFPKLDILYKYMWISLTDLNTLITFVEEESRRQKNYILEKLISRLKKEAKKDYYKIKPKEVNII